MLPMPGDIQVCDRALAEAALSNQDIVATYVNRGILYSRRGDPTRAIVDYDTATSRDPGQPEAYFNKGAALLKLGQADDAASLFSAAIERNTKFLAGAYYGRAVAQERLGNLRAAYTDYQRASAADPKWKEPKVELARFTVRRAN